MKSGLLLSLQSMATTMRCIVGSRNRSLLLRSSSSFVHHASTRSHLDASHLGSASAHFKSPKKSPFAATSIGLALASISATSLALCSSGDSTTAVTNERPIRDIMDPLHKPEHDKSCPFPEEALRHDTYKGVTLNISKLSHANPSNNAQLVDPNLFHKDLDTAVQMWRSQNRRGIWLRIPTSHAHLIPSATSLGFDFKHAEPGYCVLTKWLPSESESRLPNGPSHQVGVGVLLVHPRNGKMLVVREKSGPAAARKLVGDFFIC